MSVTDELLRNAEAYAATFKGGGLRSAPAKKVVVVACMDARLDIYALLGLSEGDAHVIRNAGGIVTEEEIRSLAISQHLLGTEEIVLIHHTDCGMASFASEEFAQRLEAEAGTRPNWTAHAFRDIEEDVRTQIRRVEASPFIPRKNVRGFIYDVESGRLSEVTAGSATSAL